MIPKPLLTDLQGVEGFSEEAFLAAHMQPPVTSVRLHPFKTQGDFLHAGQVPWCAQGRYLAERPVFTLDPAFHGGAYYVQEASSMFLDHMLRSLDCEKAGLRVLDLCAAPGGKSTLIASLLHKESLLISNEVIRSRATILDENITRWGFMNNWVTANDPRDFGRLDGYFDIMVVDAPCSGSGLFRKDVRALNDWTEANVQLCSERQERILADVWPALKTDGILIYATCSYSRQEDEAILDWLQATYDVRSLQVPVPEAWGIQTTRSANGMTGYRFFPHKVQGEGLFIAAIQKKNATPLQQYPRFKTAHDKKIQQQAGYLLSGDDAVFMQTGKEDFNALRPAHEQDWHLLQKLVYFRRAGLRLGTPAGKDWIPAHDVALSVDASPALSGIDVSREQALHFLRREEMALVDPPRGWQLIRYNGLGLGWIKSLGNRINNYLPKHWRIRMELGDFE